MNVYKHIVYNPHMKSIAVVIQEAQDIESDRTWCFLRTQPITEYEWVAIFEKWGADKLNKLPNPTDVKDPKNYVVKCEIIY